MHQVHIKYIKYKLVIGCFAVLVLGLFVNGCLNYQNRWSMGGLGLTLAQVEDGVVIKDIAPTFSNEDEALQTGDFILKVDDVDVSAWPKEAILDAISGPVGGLVSLTVLRGDEILQFDIERIILKKAEKKTLYAKKTVATHVEPVALPSDNIAPASEETASTDASASATTDTDIDTDDTLDTDDTENTDTEPDTETEESTDSDVSDTTPEKSGARSDKKTTAPASKRNNPSAS